MPEKTSVEKQLDLFDQLKESNKILTFTLFSRTYQLIDIYLRIGETFVDPNPNIRFTISNGAISDVRHDRSDILEEALLDPDIQTEWTLKIAPKDDLDRHIDLILFDRECNHPILNDLLQELQ